eukprot:scaffold3602_cov407-Prasinococcus_capsulatus_cf.AAC.6
MEEDFLNYAVAVAIGYAYHYGHLSLFFPGAQRLIGWEERSELSSVMTQPGSGLAVLCTIVTFWGYVTMANRTGNPTLPLFGQSHMSQSPHFSQLINQQLSRLSSQAQQPVETDQNSSGTRACRALYTQPTSLLSCLLTAGLLPLVGYSVFRAFLYAKVWGQCSHRRLCVYPCGQQPCGRGERCFG